MAELIDLSVLFYSHAGNSVAGGRLSEACFFILLSINCTGSNSMSMINDFIRQRRSVRKYLTRPVDTEAIHTVLEAGMSAPSAGNQKPWDFIVVTDRDIIERMCKTGPNSLPAKDAPVVILITGDTSRERYKGYWPVDCAAATENMLLEITRLELGGVWLGVHPVDERKEYLKNLFHLPSTVHPFAMISLGYPDVELTHERESRFDKRLVHYNHW